jgi:L-ascorbate metabolism protein UlaG (beta-lactamase superfamily)
MRKSATLLALWLVLLPVAATAQEPFQQDVIETSAGDLVISFIGHGTLMFTFGGTVVHVDPVMREADYTKLPKAAVILVTHRHGDHLDLEAIGHVTTDRSELVVSRDCSASVDTAIVLENWAVRTVAGLSVEAVPAYNIVHQRDNGQPYHPKGDGNGYVVTFGDKRVYVAGDTENVPEMKRLQDIDIAFLPMNLPYTMTPEMVAEAAKAFRPKILYPYHYGNTDASELVKLLEQEKGIEVRVREMS